MKQDAERIQQPPSAADAFTQLEEAIIAVQRAAYGGRGGHAAVLVRSMLVDVVLGIENHLLSVDEQSDENEVRDVFRRLRKKVESVG
jgi:hypothetical protein